MAAGVRILPDAWLAPPGVADSSEYRPARDDCRLRLVAPKRSGVLAARRADVAQIGIGLHLARGPPVSIPFFVCVLRQTFVGLTRDIVCIVPVSAARAIAGA